MSEKNQPNHSHTLTVAKQTRCAADCVDHIANASTGDRPVAEQLETPLHLVDRIDTDLFPVLSWIERRRDAGTANVLRGRWQEIARLMHEPPQKTADGILIVDLFSRARRFAWELRQWADDIEVEESQRSSPSPEQGKAGGAGRRAAGERSQRKRKKPGRPEKSPREKDRKLFDDWKASGLTLKEFAKGRRLPCKEVDAACKRHRTRERRAQIAAHKTCQAD
jgi:hypothetical protein